MESKLINGDCLEELKELDDNTVDLICSDPPYGLSFMGKKWDSFNEVISFEGESHVYAKKGFKRLPRNKPIAMEEFFVPIWKECLRVLKPGGFAFIMAAPKQDVLQKQIEAMDVAGVKTNFTSIYWAYATGFPKAMNVGKKTEKENLEGSYAGYQPKPAVEIVIVGMKPLEKKGYLDQALDNQKGVTWLDDVRIPFAGMSDKEQFDKDNVAAMKNFDGKYEKGEGKMYEGGWEKPNREGLSRGIHASRKTTKRKPREENTVFKTSGFNSEDNDTADASPLGRFAANLLVSDNVLDTGKKTKSSGGRSYQNTNDMYSGGWAHDDEGTGENPGKGDEGDFSRYYSLDEWWKSRVSRLPEEVRNTFPFLVVPKASVSEKNMGLDSTQGKYLDDSRKVGSPGGTNPRNRGAESKRKNFHPTVKPVQLFSYLITLGSRKEDVVLDPFMGSGTTTISCVFSERKYIGIEREKEYFKIAESRVEKALNPANLVKHDFF